MPTPSPLSILEERLLNLLAFRPNSEAIASLRQARELVRLASQFGDAARAVPGLLNILTVQVDAVLERMKPGASFRQALDALDALLQQGVPEYPVVVQDKTNSTGFKPVPAEQVRTFTSSMTRNFEVAKKSLAGVKLGLCQQPLAPFFFEQVYAFGEQCVASLFVGSDRNHVLSRLREQAWELFQLAERSHFVGNQMLLECHKKSQSAAQHELLICRYTPSETLVPLIQEAARALCILVAVPRPVSYGSFRWSGQVYCLSRTQAAIIRILHEAYLQGMPDIALCDLLFESGSDSKRLADVFKTLPNWKNLIVKGTGKDLYRLKLVSLESLS